MGLTIYAFASCIKEANFAIVGRAIFGVGAEAQNIWTASILSIWFFYGEISFASA